MGLAFYPLGSILCFGFIVAIGEWVKYRVDQLRGEWS